MTKERPDFQDADLVLKLYDLRREGVMRESRAAMMKVDVRSYEDLVALTQPSHPANAAWRQVSSYWEMTWSFARHGIVNPDFLMENTGEGLFLYAKVQPYLERFRKDYSPTAFRNAEWITTQCETGRQRLAMVQARIKQLAAAKS